MADQERHERARELFRKAATLHDRISEELGETLPIVFGEGRDIEELRKAKVLTMLLKRHRLHRVIRQVYPQTTAADDIYQIDTIVDEVFRRIRSAENKLVRIIRDEFRAQRDLLNSIREESRSNFDRVLQDLDAIDQSIDEFRREMEARLDRMDESLDVLRSEVAEVRTRIDELHDKVDEISETVYKVLDGVEQLANDQQEIKTQLRALRLAVMPPPWPGDDEAGQYLRVWELPEDLTNALAGAIEGRLRKLMDAQVFEGRHKDKHTKWAKAGPLKTKVWEHEVSWHYRIEPVNEGTHFNIRWIRLGVDKISGDLYLFLDMTAQIDVAGHGDAKVGAFGADAGTGQHKFEGTLRADTKVRIALINDGEQWDSDVVEMSAKVADLRFSGDLFNMFRGKLQAEINDKLSSETDEFKEKMDQALEDRVAGNLPDVIKQILAHARQNAFVATRRLSGWSEVPALVE